MRQPTATLRLEDRRYRFRAFVEANPGCFAAVLDLEVLLAPGTWSSVGPPSVSSPQRMTWCPFQARYHVGAKLNELFDPRGFDRHYVEFEARPREDRLIWVQNAILLGGVD